MLAYQIRAASLFSESATDLNNNEFDDVLRELIFGYPDHEQYRRASLRYPPHVLYKKASLKPIIGQNGKKLFNRNVHE